MTRATCECCAKPAEFVTGGGAGAEVFSCSAHRGAFSLDGFEPVPADDWIEIDDERNDIAPLNRSGPWYAAHAE